MAAANALTTAATVATELGIIAAVADTAALERLIGVASDAIEHFCGRPFAYSATATQRLAPSGTNRLILDRRPVESITSIVDDGTTVASGDYSIEDGALGFVWRDSTWPTAGRTVPDSMAADEIPGSSERTILVTFAGGYITPQQVVDAAAETPARVIVRTLPADLEQACIDTVVSMWRRRGADVQGDAYNASNSAIARATGGALPDAVLPTLRRYRTVPFA